MVKLDKFKRGVSRVHIRDRSSDFYFDNSPNLVAFNVRNTDGTPSPLCVNWLRSSGIVIMYVHLPYIMVNYRFMQPG